MNATPHPALIPLVLIAIVFLFCLCLVVGVVLVMVLRRRQTAPTVMPLPSQPPPEVMERQERISREIEKIDAMVADGRINATEAAELKQALGGEPRHWPETSPETAGPANNAIPSQGQKRLARSTNRIIAGVCGGFAEWIGCDAVIIRIAYVLLSLCSTGFPGLLLYLILWVVMPKSDTAGGGLGKGLLILLLCLVAVPVILIGLFFLLRIGLFFHR